MQAGFARVKITPPLGTKMIGFAARDRGAGCAAVHDELFARALFLEHAGETALIMGLDLCFFGRAEADRFRGALGRKLDLAPRQILLNTSHTHTGPATAPWAYCGYECPDQLYYAELEAALLRAALTAKAGRREATLRVGQTRTRLPVNRRRPDGKGGIMFRPNPEGTIHGTLPLALFKDLKGRPICLLYSVACHLSTINFREISADYPGVAGRILDQHLDLPEGGSLFLQGCGGDSKPCVVGDGRDEVGPRWRAGDWADVEAGGRLVAGEILPALDRLNPAEPVLCARELEMEWPLEPPPARADLTALGADPRADDLKKLWARRQLQLLERGGGLPAAAPITAHGLQLARGVRIVGLEGEPVAELGLLIERFYGGGVTFALGYTDGAQLYLPSERMLSEGGYEVESYYEYGFPSRLAGGMERILAETLAALRAAGVG